MSDGKPNRANSSAGLAAVAVSLIIGYPVQTMIDPKWVGPEEYLASVHDVLDRLGKAA